MIPSGAVTSRHKDRKNIKVHNRKSFSQTVTQGQERQIAEYFKFIYADCKDILTTNDIAEMTGLNRGTIMKLVQSGHIKSIAARPKYLIPKIYLLEFVVTPRFIEAKSNSALFKKILGGFEIWKTAQPNQKGGIDQEAYAYSIFTREVSGDGNGENKTALEKSRRFIQP